MAFAALVAVGPSAVAQVVDVEQDRASRDLLNNVIDAISLDDEEWLADLEAEALQGSVWLPEVGINAILERDAELLVFAVDLLDQNNEGLLNMSYDFVEYERDLVMDARQGDQDAEFDLQWADEDGQSILEMFARRGYDVPASAEPVLGPLAAVGGFQDVSMSLYDDALNAVDTANGGGVNPLFFVPIIALAGGLVGFVVIRSRRTEAIAHTDALTGLANRRRLERDIEANKAHGRAAVLMIDVDHFKIFNDTHGHAMGDEVLRRVGAVLASNFREADVPYRYGGEEFCVILANTTPQEALGAGERARAAIAAIELPSGLQVTASVGVALAPAFAEHETIEAADHALYQAKNNGRNQVKLSGETVTF